MNGMMEDDDDGGFVDSDMLMGTSIRESVKDLKEKKQA